MSAHIQADTIAMIDWHCKAVFAGRLHRIPDLDRTIYCDGVPIAQAFQIDGGQNTGRWQWAGRWSPAEFGIVETLDEALAAIKVAVTDEKLKTLPPGPYPKQPLSGN